VTSLLVPTTPASHRAIGREFFSDLGCEETLARTETVVKSTTTRFIFPSDFGNNAA